MTRIPTRLTFAAETSLLGDRLRTAAVLAVVAVIAVVAAADALRGGGPPSQTTPPPAPSVRLPALPHGALTGTLWYADAHCRLHRVDLASGHDRLVARSAGHCRFWVSPDGRYVAMHPGAPFVPPADMELLDLATGQITTPFRRADLALAPPAWSPDSRALAVCDGLHGPPSIRVYHLPTGQITTPARDACFPAYVGPRLAFRDLNSVTHLGDRLIADSGTLTELLHRGVYQEPAPVGAGGVLAVSATTVTPAGGPPPITTVVLLDGSGRVVSRWDTGVIADTVSLLADGRVIAASRPAGVIVEDADTREVVTSAAGRPIVSAATAPGAPRMLALADGRRIVFETMSGQARWALPVRTAYLQWTAAP
ncbi:MAG TPA: hypothetical protein VGJ11_06495 [Gaiellales bacterium]